MRHGLAAALLSALIALACAADTLVFKDGKRLEGTVVEEDAETVTFKVKSIQTKFKKEDIAEIIRSGAPPVERAEDPAAALRAARLAMSGDATLDPLRDAASRALDAVLAKQKALQTLAKKTEAQTRAFDAQLKKVKLAEAEAEKARGKWREADARRVKAQEALEALIQSGGKPAPGQAEEIERRRQAADAALKPAEGAEARAATEGKKLDELKEKYAAAAATLRPAVMELAEAIAGLDTAWGALAAAEEKALQEAPGVGAAPEAGMRTRIEGRVVKAEDGVLVLATGDDLDPAKWKTEVRIAAPGVAAKAGELVVVTARKGGATGWIAEEVAR